MHQLQDEIQEIDTDSLSVAGDFNVAFEQTDNIAEVYPHREREVTIIKEMLSNLDIHDVWRTNHPGKKEYTWSKPTPFISRTDCIFSDTTSLTKITNTSTEGFPHSDHKLSTVKINMNSFKRGPGYWKFNSSLLSEADFAADTNNLIDAHLSENQNDNLEMT